MKAALTKEMARELLWMPYEKRKPILEENGWSYAQIFSKALFPIDEDCVDSQEQE